MLVGVIVLLLVRSACWSADQSASPPRHAEEQEGSARIIHRADVIPSQSTNGSTGPVRGGLWPVYSTPEARFNYFAITGKTALHFHPDAEHRLYVLEGHAVVTCGTNVSTVGPGDFIVIPKGVRHQYDVPAPGDRALLLTLDAPPFDPRKTVNLDPPRRTE